MAAYLFIVRGDENDVITEWPDVQLCVGQSHNSTAVQMSHKLRSCLTFWLAGQNERFNPSHTSKSFFISSILNLSPYLATVCVVIQGFSNFLGPGTPWRGEIFPGPPSVSQHRWAPRPPPSPAVKGVVHPKNDTFSIMNTSRSLAFMEICLVFKTF